MTQSDRITSENMARTAVMTICALEPRVLVGLDKDVANEIVGAFPAIDDAPQFVRGIYAMDDDTLSDTLDKLLLKKRLLLEFLPHLFEPTLKRCKSGFK